MTIADTSSPSALQRSQADAQKLNAPSLGRSGIAGGAVASNVNIVTF
jgi:hypothetical protein